MGRIITAIIFIGAGVAIFITWTNPMIDEISVLRAEESELDGSLAKLKELQTLRDSLLDRYNSTDEADLEYLDKFLPSKPNAIDFVIEADNIARSNGLSLKSIDVKAPDEKETAVAFEKEADNTRAIPVVMRVAGSYKSFASFVYDLERNLRLSKIESIDFSAGEADLYDYNIRISTYWLK